jgi:Putative peptidoglycan binding domain
MNKKNFFAALAGLSLLVFAATPSFAGGHGGWSGGHGGWSGGHGGWSGGHGHWGGGYHHGYWYHNHWYGGFYPGFAFYPFDYGYGYYPYGYYPGYYDNGYSGSDYREASAHIQQALAQMGYYSGPIDGQIGPSTLEAVRLFQHDRGLVVTGQLDGPTLQALGH